MILKPNHNVHTLFLLSFKIGDSYCLYAQLLLTKGPQRLDAATLEINNPTLAMPVIMTVCSSNSELC